jgi:YVTN family beta-propeller protein
VLAAVEGHRALSGYPWPDGASVKVRVGIHTARAAPIDGRYTGLAVHRASRICSAGHGGQILVSQATQSLLEDEEEDLAAGLRDLGEQRLKDIERPVRLYQVAAPGLPAEFPPLRGEPEPDEPAAPSPPVWRRWPVLAAVAVVILALVGAAAFVATRDAGGGLGGVQPNHLGVIDPDTNEIVDEIQVGLLPGPVAVGGGSVWVGNLDGRDLSRVDARHRSSAGTIPLGGRTPTGLAASPDAVFVAHGALGQLSRVDSRFGQVSEPVTVGVEALGSPTGAVTVDGGRLWAVFGDSTLARLDPDTLRVTGRTVTAAAPAGVAVQSGLVWVVTTDTSAVARYAPRTFEAGELGTPTSVGRRPTAIAAGEGALWVANTGSDTVTWLEPGTPPVTEQIRVGRSPVAVAVGEGAVWVANAGDGTISRIDPDSREVVETIDVGNQPAGIAVGAGAVWVAVQAP